MTALLFLLAAAAFMYADKIKAFVEKHGRRLTGREVAAVACLICAAAWWYGSRETVIDDGRPKPVPGSVGELDLRGLFKGPSAADDAAALAALCDELAAKVEYDGNLAKPRMTTGWQISDLRTAARDYRLEGSTFGERQPEVRDAVKTYLERPEILGKNGGPITAKDRARWVQAFRDIAIAAGTAIR